MNANKVLKLCNIEDVEKHISRLNDSAEKAKKSLQEILETKTPMEFLWQVKFEKVGSRPLDEEPLNFIEQVNQTFTYLASFLASKILFQKYKGLERLTLNLGTAPGPDIKSDQFGGIVAEVFATVSPTNNKKLQKEIEKISKGTEENKYVFYLSPESPPASSYDENGVRVRYLGAYDSV